MLRPAATSFFFIGLGLSCFNTHSPVVLLRNSHLSTRTKSKMLLFSNRWRLWKRMRTSSPLETWFSFHTFSIHYWTRQTGRLAKSWTLLYLEIVLPPGCLPCVILSWIDSLSSSFTPGGERWVSQVCNTQSDKSNITAEGGLSKGTKGVCDLVPWPLVASGTAPAAVGSAQQFSFTFVLFYFFLSVDITWWKKRIAQSFWLIRGDIPFEFVSPQFGSLELRQCF